MTTYASGLLLNPPHGTNGHEGVLVDAERVVWRCRNCQEVVVGDDAWRALVAAGWCTGRLVALAAPESPSRPSQRAVALFGGCGGSSRGLEDAGFEVVAFDYWQPAVDTHNANGMVAHLHDLSDETLDDAIPGAPLWWISAPCQPFSAAGDGAGEFDDRDGFPWALRLVAKRLPAVAIFENVKGLTFRKHHAYFAGILHALRELGYHVEWRVLNCANHGVPQTRERCIILARRDGGPVTWPAPTHTEQPGMFTAKWVTMAEALGWGMTERPFVTIATSSPTGGPRMDGCGSSTARQRLATERDEGRRTLHYRQTNRDGEPITCNVTDRPSPTVGTMSGGQWWIERPATTINGDPRVSAPGRHDPEVSGSQQADAIRLEVHELATLQGFPSDWTWCGTKTSIARQIGNAVPPALARVLAEANRPVVVETSS